VIEVHSTVPALEAAFRRYNIRNAAAIQVDGTVFLSGMAALDLDTGEMVEGDMTVQARHTIGLCQTVLGEIGLTLDHVVKVNCFLADVGDFAAWNDVYLEMFEAPYPCRTTVGAQLVVGRLEVEMVAASEPRR